MARHQSREEVAVETVQIVHRVSHRKFRMKIEQQMYVAERIGEIEQRDMLARVIRELHADVDCDCRCPDAAFRPHHHDQTIQRRTVSVALEVLREARQNIF